MTELFNAPALRVEQPRKVLATRARYDFFDATGTLLASATETAERTRLKAVRAALPGNVLAGAQTLLVHDPAETLLLIIEKHDTNRLTTIRRPVEGAEGAEGDALFDGDLIGSIRAERTTRHYALLDAADKRVGEVTGDLGLRKFSVTDTERRHVAQINKKWAGLRAEMLTNADRYSVEITGKRITETLRALIVVTAVVLDLTLHESKDVV
ncbi:phospholipid scramblase-related protein [Thermomonospora echinospora]|uniref:phospholipid scramblase-related protein n=1 Tax=Thermomonospora echinospora TaxID=1992 RepID=UPI00135C4DF2|nr:phospholipid scramblase-related protein [Thermomonospora echinospora]